MSAKFALVIAFVYCLWVFRRIRASSTKRYPPGPPGHVLLGNLLQMPSEYAMIRFREWCKTYGMYTMQARRSIFDALYRSGSPSLGPRTIAHRVRHSSSGRRFVRQEIAHLF